MLGWFLIVVPCEFSIPKCNFMFVKVGCPSYQSNNRRDLAVNKDEMKCDNSYGWEFRSNARKSPIQLLSIVILNK